AYSEEIARIRGELFHTEADLAELRAGQADTNVTAASDLGTTNDAAVQKVPADVQERYKAVCSRLAYLQKRQADYFGQGYTEENKLVKENRVQLDEATKVKRTLEEQSPGLAALMASAGAVDPSTGNEAPNTAAKVAALQTRIKTLHGQLAQVQAEAVKMGDAETKISELMRKKASKESLFENFKNGLERRQIDEALTPGQLFANIPRIEDPTPVSRDFKKFYKNLGTLVAGGVLFGLALAFLIEFYLDRSIKRPIEVQMAPLPQVGR
ncbi:MAG: hypothetical protein JF609_08875, partial [Verrucomicrobia bacterium]|nr:hypothetical protein [Verrucomicrobiota bacterium]